MLKMVKKRVNKLTYYGKRRIIYRKRKETGTTR